MRPLMSDRGRGSDHRLLAHADVAALGAQPGGREIVLHHVDRLLRGVADVAGAEVAAGGKGHRRQREHVADLGQHRLDGDRLRHTAGGDKTRPSRKDSLPAGAMLSSKSKRDI